MRIHIRGVVKLLNTYAPNPQQGAEIGVWRGHSAQSLRQAFPDCHLILVDPWKEWDDKSRYNKRHGDTGSMTQEAWNAIYQEAMERISGSYDVLRMISTDAAKHIPDEFLDFVFIDADHTYAGVMEDIATWTPKVRQGGLICGHDYKSKADRAGFWGVSRAVHESFPDTKIMVKRGYVWGVIK